ncbi:hypothetical protein J6590_076355 [Homalodisca vitripennis]|nr:hypothetical protein J6590_076355 [Homalodisca vitripennis]
MMQILSEFSQVFEILSKMKDDDASTKLSRHYPVSYLDPLYQPLRSRTICHTWFYHHSPDSEPWSFSSLCFIDFSARATIIIHFTLQLIMALARLQVVLYRTSSVLSGNSLLQRSPPPPTRQHSSHSTTPPDLTKYL